jgi:hypothetical protein
MTNTWKCDKWGRHFTNIENRIGLARRFHICHSHVHIPYQDPDCAKSVGYTRSLPES